MAIILPTAPIAKLNITAANTYVLGSPSDRFVSTYAVQFADGGSYAGSFVVQARSRVMPASKGVTTGANPVTGDDVAFTTISYWNPVTAAYAITAITAAAGLLLIPASGFEIALNFTSVSAGSLTVHMAPI